MDAGDGAFGNKGRRVFPLPLSLNAPCQWTLWLGHLTVWWCERGPWWEMLIWMGFVAECNPDGEAFGSGPQILQGKAQQ